MNGKKTTRRYNTVRSEEPDGNFIHFLERAVHTVQYDQGFNTSQFFFS